MQTAAQNLRLVTGFSIQRDQAGFDRAFAKTPTFFDNANPVIRDKADTGQN
jgi:hypothetical protein